jgi:phage repressor protein C with HTH and peptisase S24 domain
VRGFGEGQAKSYAAALRANWVWLLTGTSEPFAGAPQATAPSGKHLPTQPRLSDPRPISEADLPVYRTSEGGPSGMLIAFEPIDWIGRPDTLQNVRDAFGIYAIGSSMEPRYEHGDLIVVHPTRPPKREDDVLLLSNGENSPAPAMVRRLIGWTDTAWSTRQYNPGRDEELRRADWPRAHVVLARFNRN